MMILSTIAEASALYRIPASTIRRWISEGRLPTVEQRPALFDLNQLDRVLAEIGAGRKRATHAAHSRRM